MRKILHLGLALLALSGLAISGQAGEMHATNKWAWSESSGYVNFRATNATVGAAFAARVHVDGEDGYMEGWAWSESAGWIQLGNTNGGVPYANTDATNWGVNVVGTNLCGFAWSEAAGWVNFAPTNATVLSRVTLNSASGRFDGYAWSEALGWIHVRGAGETPLYAMETEGTTLVTLYDFGLRAENGHVWVCWQTASEENTVGFDVYRWTDGAWVKVNGAFVYAQGVDGLGASYGVVDAGANATDTFLYKLVETETGGGTQEYGPFDVAAWGLRLDNVVASAEGVTIRWLGRAQDTYEIWKSVDLMRGFERLASGIAGVEPVTSFTDENAAGNAFYRIRAERE